MQASLAGVDSGRVCLPAIAPGFPMGFRPLTSRYLSRLAHSEPARTTNTPSFLKETPNGVDRAAS